MTSIMTASVTAMLRKLVDACTPSPAGEQAKKDIGITRPTSTTERLSPGNTERLDERAEGLKEKIMIGTNTGHGHVWERPDGRRARCGGPALCPTCAGDQARIDVVKSEEAAFKLLTKAASDLIADVKRRHPGEELRCPYMIKLEEGLLKVELLKDWHKGEEDAAPQEGEAQEDQDHGC